MPEVLRRYVTRSRDGSYSLRIDDGLAALLATFADSLDPLLDDPSADPSLRRLYPPARPDDLIAEAAWQIEQGAALTESRRAALDALRTCTPGTKLDEGELIAWVQGLNAVRLVLAERLGVGDDPDSEEATAIAAIRRAEDRSLSDDEREAAARVAQAWQVYEVIAVLIAHAVRALDH